jgi:hypothetical protein
MVSTTKRLETISGHESGDVDGALKTVGVGDGVGGGVLFCIDIHS